MQRIYEPESLMEGEMFKGMLASEGIEVPHDRVGICWAARVNCRCSGCWGFGR